MLYSDKSDIKKAIKEAARLQHITLAELARRIGKSPQEVNDILTRKKNISFQDVQRLAGAMNCLLIFDIIPADDLQPAGAPAGRDPGNI